MSKHMEFDVAGKRFELSLVEVISAGIIGGANTSMAKKFVARVRPIGSNDWTKVPGGSPLNFDTPEEALAEARQFVEADPPRFD